MQGGIPFEQLNVFVLHDNSPGHKSHMICSNYILKLGAIMGAINLSL